MPFKKSQFVYLFVTCLFFLLTSCTNPINSNANSQSNNASSTTEQNIVTKDDATELANIIKLPFELDDAVFYEEEIEGSGKKLRAFILFYEEDEAIFKTRFEKTQPIETVDFDLEKWFPTELVAQSDIAGDQRLHGSVFPADDFLKEPYIKGRLIRVEGTEFYMLELTTY